MLCPWFSAHIQADSQAAEASILLESTYYTKPHPHSSSPSLHPPRPQGLENLGKPTAVLSLPMTPEKGQGSWHHSITLRSSKYWFGKPSLSLKVQLMQRPIPASCLPVQFPFHSLFPSIPVVGLIQKSRHCPYPWLCQCTHPGDREPFLQRREETALSFTHRVRFM